MDVAACLFCMCESDNGGCVCHAHEGEIITIAHAARKAAVFFFGCSKLVVTLGSAGSAA